MSKDYLTDYGDLTARAKALTDDVPYRISNLSNICSLIYETMEKVNWAGFYLLSDGALILGPFQGKTACIRIPLGKGVCGTAALRDSIQLVPDVSLFPGHIACDPNSRSEIVIPIHENGNLFGVLDLDSAVVDRFGEEDRKGLSSFVEWLESALPAWDLAGFETR